jgi:hypothetical protein
MYGLPQAWQVAIAQVFSGFRWRSEDQEACLSYYLEGKALRYIETQSPVWMREQPPLEYVMMKMNKVYSVHLDDGASSDYFPTLHIPCRS